MAEQVVPVAVQLDLTKLVLAVEMGTTSETLSRTLAKFRAQKLVQVKGNTITLTRPRAGYSSGIVSFGSTFTIQMSMAPIQKNAAATR